MLFAQRRTSAVPAVIRRSTFRILVGLLVALALPALPARAPALAGDGPQTISASEIKPGMKGVAYTIYEGDTVEKVDLVVLGVMQNALGPKEDVILVQLLGDKAEHDGVVAGMSGSPVYFDGKLAGAISLKLGIFTKEAIGGVTPIANMLDAVKAGDSPASRDANGAAEPASTATSLHIPLPADFSRFTSAGGGQFLVPIETPLIAAGLYPQTLAQFDKQLLSWGVAVMAGGTAAPSPEDAQLKPGEMVGVDLVRGDLSLSTGCTVTTVEGDRITACGHPIFGYGNVKLPMSRAHVLTTLASSMASTKIISTGGIIGTLTGDRATAITGTLGAGPPMVPMEIRLDTPTAKKDFHFQVIENPELTPLLVAIAAYNGIVGSPAYGEGSTLQLDGSIELKGHTPVRLDDMFAPTDAPIPSGYMVAIAVQSAFSQIYSNPYEQPDIEKIDLHVTSLAERRWAMIDNAWIEKSEVQPGETVSAKVLLRPYRGAPFIQEIPITIPDEVARGPLQLVISGADTVNRNVQFLAASSQAQLPGLEELIKLVNRERHNDCLYATLLQPTPTLLVEDKEMPNAPVSEINVLNERHNPGGARLLWQSTAGQWSVEMHQVIAGEHTLTITVK
jgi:SpoIVB peptidase S55